MMMLLLETETAKFQFQIQINLHSQVNQTSLLQNGNTYEIVTAHIHFVSKSDKILLL